ncbi:hypothetical protein FACS189490_13820 [Clostridia bacterium]|nr:hypothetical protein FACS189490_13820 [Clostridia bacterium]
MGKTESEDRTQSVTNYIEEIAASVRAIEETLNDPGFAKKIKHGQNDIYGEIDRMDALLKEMKINVPEEIKAGKRLFSDSEKILNDARIRASLIIQNANEDAAHLVEESVIVSQAREVARKMDSASRKRLHEYFDGMFEYAFELINTTEASILKAHDDLELARQSFEAKLSAVEDGFTQLRMSFSAAYGSASDELNAIRDDLYTQKEKAYQDMENNRKEIQKY